MEIYKAKKVKYEKFTMEKLQENTLKKHKLYKARRPSLKPTKRTHKENATINKAKKKNGTVITDSRKN
jgi:hypothetical protein